jgi:acyl dehydratase
VTSSTGLSGEQRYFEDVHLGDEFEQGQHPTTEHVLAFVGTWDRNSDRGTGRFSDPEEARRQGLARPIVPGNMSVAMITRLVTDWMGPMGRIVSLDVSFRRPVLHNDRLRCIAVVTDEGDDALEGAGPAIVRLDVALENEGGERPVQGTAEVELPRRE